MNYLNTNTPQILFEEARNSEIYVDKSLLIEKVSKYIRTKNKYICITRPRRFGKTANINMLGAYYTKGYHADKMFAGLKIADTGSYKKNLNQYNVIYIDFSRLPDPCGNYADYIAYVKNNIYEDIEQHYNLQRTAGKSVSDMLKLTGESFVFILDEWDSIFYNSFMSQTDKDSYLKFIKGLLKDQPYVELAYMTGVLPIAKYSSGSELNMFDEYNFMNDNVFDEYFGFSEDEVKHLCSKLQTVPYEDMKRWYSGGSESEGVQCGRTAIGYPG